MGPCRGWKGTLIGICEMWMWDPNSSPLMEQYVLSTIELSPQHLVSKMSFSKQARVSFSDRHNEVVLEIVPQSMRNQEDPI